MSDWELEEAKAQPVGCLWPEGDCNGDGPSRSWGTPFGGSVEGATLEELRRQEELDEQGRQKQKQESQPKKKRRPSRKGDVTPTDKPKQSASAYYESSDAALFT